MVDLSEHKNLNKFERNFLSEFLNDIEKRENSSWSKSWNFVETQNAFTGHKYSGMNDFYLELMTKARKLDDPRFATFNQARKNNHYIKKGSKGLPIQYFSFINKETKKKWDEAAFRRKTKNMTPEEKAKEEEKKVALSKTFHVFNARDIINKENNLSLAENDPLEISSKKMNTNEKIDEFEKNLIDNMEVGFNERHSEGAFYTPNLDEVTMPLKEQFNSYEERMATLIHELGHATGHKSRLDRNLNTNSLSSEYKKEEVIVEMNSVFTSNVLGLDLSDEQKENHLTYLDGWGEKIKEQPKDFLFALKDSLKIKDYMLENGKFEDIFLEKENIVDLNLEDKQTKELIGAFKKFSDFEYENNLSEKEITSLIKDEDYMLPVAYTEVENNSDTLFFQKKVSYDLKNQQLVNTVETGTCSYSDKQDINIETMTGNLLNANFDDFIRQDNMGFDLEEVTNVVQLATFSEDKNYLKNFAEEKGYDIKYLDLDYSLKNKNHILKNINEDFFKKNNLNIPKDFIQDKDFKHLIDFQSVHYEEIKEIPHADSYKLIFNGDIDDDTEIEEYSNYRDLWENNYRNRFIEDLNDLSFNEIKNSEKLANVPELLNKLAFKDSEISNEINKSKKYEKSILEKDKDNDGIPDRTDIDDSRNSVQTTADLDKVNNRTDKTHNDDSKKEQKQSKKRTSIRR